MAELDRQKALDHVMVLMFENRSFDHLLGRLYRPGEVRRDSRNTIRISTPFYFGLGIIYLLVGSLT